MIYLKPIAYRNAGLANSPPVPTLGFPLPGNENREASVSAAVLTFTDIVLNLLPLALESYRRRVLSG